MHPNSQKYRPTLILIAANIAFYIFTSIQGGSIMTTDYSLLFRYGQVNGLVLYYGYYYQLISSMFVHATLAHLAGNMLFLMIFGLRGEEMFSLPEFLGIYFLGGLTGNLLSLLILPVDVPSVGASGAIFAMFGACIVYTRSAMRQSLIGVIIYALFLLFISSGPGVNNLAHLGGLITGLLVGRFLARKRNPLMVSVNYSYTV